MVDSTPDAEFDHFLRECGIPVGEQKEWADERYAATVDIGLLRRFYHEKLTMLAAHYVIDQITGWKSWRDAFLQVVHEESRREAN